MDTPNYGTSLFLFYASGLLPFYLFLRVSSQLRGIQTQPFFLLPGITSLDTYFSVVIFNSLISITTMAIVFFSMWIYGIEEARPDSMVNCAVPLILFIVLGAGIGIINNVITRYLKFWTILYGVLTRGLMFFSGVIVIVDLVPLWLREWCIINPLSHGIEWFRLGIYGKYPVNSLDEFYLVQWALVALAVGLVVDRAALRGAG